MDASELTQQRKIKTVYADFISQQQELKSGCANRITLEEDILYIDIGEVITTPLEQKRILEAAATTCPPAPVLPKSPVVKSKSFAPVNNILEMTFTGSLIDSGSDALIEIGVIYNTIGYPLITNSVKVIVPLLLLLPYTFVVNFTVSANVKTFARAYATNSLVTTYGNILTAVPNLDNVPSVSTLYFTSLPPTVLGWATLSFLGIVNNNGGHMLLEDGVVYTTDPSIASIASISSIASVPSLGYFSSIFTVSSLSTVYASMYGINSLGTGYGSVLSTIPQVGSLATVVTNRFESIDIVGNMSITGDIAITGIPLFIESGIVYNNGGTPTILDNKIISNNDSFTVNFSSINTNLIYATAYATNSFGTSYGNVLTANPVIKVAPTVSTDSFNSIDTLGTMSLSGTVISDGDSVILEMGAIYSTNLTVIAELPGLKTYSVTFVATSVSTISASAYATNAIGTTYGLKLLATPIITTPFISTVSLIILSSTCVVTAYVSSIGGPIASECGAVINETVIDGTVPADGTGIFSVITHVQNGLIYCIPFAKNGGGISYGTTLSTIT